MLPLSWLEVTEPATLTGAVAEEAREVLISEFKWLMFACVIDIVCSEYFQQMV